MSYYRSSTLVATTSQAVPVASTSRLPALTVLEDEDAKPVQGKADKGKGKEVKQKKYTMEEMEKLAGRICNVQPLGACPKPQLAGSLYCANHSCQALNADGDRCGNWVSNPASTKFCASGWHLENSRHTHLSDLMAYRNSLIQQQSDERARQTAAQLYYIEQRFPSTSSSSSNDSGSPRSPFTRGTNRANGSRDISEERGWGSHGVDTWWKGTWGLSSESKSRRSSE
ncbi:uncharacterized protein IL334_003282 [Kwoniella shivajii]|uniref:SCA7 domain-containing protein n=1 Tax=Kwoniella shivajii TaxID=564305 RepID=A0ABZ1D187_9TREE|nr:hypothetical protein IL334_003282 [Kwoniella shivajii]